ncbi:MAG: mannitol dehydrogenase family protein, partial [Caldimonas sp.]
MGGSHALHVATPSTLPRLNAGALGALPVDVERPTYDRPALGAAIVQLGIGAFARAHLAAVNEAALHATGDLRWGLVGVSLRQADTRDALAPQDGLYALGLRDADAAGTPRESLRIVGGLRDLLVAPEAPAAVLERIAAAETRIVSLTVTEKGYCHDPASGTLRFDDPDIAHDLQTPAAPRSAIGFIVHGLRLRRQRGHAPVTLLSCDNLPSNGRTLRGLVLAFAARLDAGLHDWIENECTFPNSMVDRIVPRTTADDRTRIEARLGCVDAWPVVAEPFLDWVIEDRFAAGRPQWEHGGARFVADAAPFERMKLRMLNGSHSALAYLGATAGFATVDAAVGLPALRAFVDAMMRLEIAPTLAADGLDPERYRRRLLERFANPALR